MPERLLDAPGLWRMDTFLVPQGALSSGDVVLQGAEGHHAADVMRVADGQLIRLVDGCGAEAIGRVDSVGRSEVAANVLEARDHSREDGARLTVAQALLKGRAFDDVVRRCGELGVESIVPITTARSIGRVPAGGERGRLSRWESVALAALKQSRGVFLPTIEPVMDLSAVARLGGDVELPIVAWEEGGVPLSTALRSHTGRILLIVGPEGGLTEAEVGILTDAGFVAVSLGRRVLRADWAAAAAAAMIASEVGGLLP